MTMRTGFILAGMLLMGGAMGEDGQRPCRVPIVHREPIITIVIDVRYISAADMALLFGGRYLSGNQAMISRYHSGGYRQARPYRAISSPWTSRGHHGTRTVRCRRW